MRLREKVYLIGSGILGMNSTDEYDCNVYLLDGGAELAIIDCGTGYGVEKIIAELKRDGFEIANVKYILLTHSHMDHAGGAAKLQKLTHARVCASVLTAKIVEVGDEQANGLAQAREVGIYPADCIFNKCLVDLRLSAVSRFTIGDLTIEVIPTPGHSGDMISYYCPEIRTLFCGDTVFSGGEIAIVKTKDFSLKQLSQSLTLLQSYQVDSLMPGHMSPVIRDGGFPIRQAVKIFSETGIPKSII